jgi:hypothetical protein
MYNCIWLFFLAHSRTDAEIKRWLCRGQKRPNRPHWRPCSTPAPTMHCRPPLTHTSHHRPTLPLALRLVDATSAVSPRPGFRFPAERAIILTAIPRLEAPYLSYRTVSYHTRIVSYDTYRIRFSIHIAVKNVDWGNRLLQVSRVNWSINLFS